MRITPEVITSLQPNQVFVFGSNTEGRHGKGAALIARQKFGAIYGQASGKQGQSYAIITKDLSKGIRSIPLSTIQQHIRVFLEYAMNHPDSEFLVVKIGCSLGGYTVNEISTLFKFFKIPTNVFLPQCFWDTM